MRAMWECKLKTARGLLLAAGLLAGIAAVHTDLGPAGVAFAAPAVRPERPGGDPKGLEGTWKAVSFKELAPPAPGGGAAGAGFGGGGTGAGGGGPAPAPGGGGRFTDKELAGARWVITADTVEIHIAGKTLASKLKPDPAAKPTAIDLAPCPVPSQLKGTCEGIYELKGDTLTICYGPPGQPRPKSFEAPAAGVVYLFALRREVLREKFVLRHEHPVTAVALGTTYAAAGDAGGVVNLWDEGTGKLREDVFGRGAGKPVTAIQVGGDYKTIFLVTHGGQGICQFDVAKAGRKPPGGAGGTDWRAFGATPDGKLWAVTIGSNEIQFFDNSLDQGVMRAIRSSQISHAADAEIRSLAFSPDSSAVCSVTADGGVHLGAIRAKKIVWSAAAKDLDPTVASFSPDGKTVAVAGKKGAVRLFDATTGKPGLAVPAHGEPVTAVAWLAGGTRLVTASEDRTVRVFDARTGTRMWEGKGHTAAVRCLAVRSDGPGTLFASGGDDKTVRIWTVPE